MNCSNKQKNALSFQIQDSILTNPQKPNKHFVNLLIQIFKISIISNSLLGLNTQNDNMQLLSVKDGKIDGSNDRFLPKKATKIKSVCKKIK